MLVFLQSVYLAAIVEAVVTSVVPISRNHDLPLVSNASKATLHASADLSNSSASISTILSSTFSNLTSTSAGSAIITSKPLNYSPIPAGASAASAVCGKCGIEAPGGVALVYWEPDNVSTPSNISVAPNQGFKSVSDGFTFTSPSVYVIYSQLRATASCGDSALTTIGPSYDLKTVEYSSRFLAYGTLSSPDQRCDENVVVDGFHTIDFTSLYYKPFTPSTTTKPGCQPYVNPRLSLPAELTSVDLSWASCEPLFYGAFDPPVVLKKTGRLAPPETDPGSVTKVVDNFPKSSPGPGADSPSPVAKPNNGPEPQHTGHHVKHESPVDDSPPHGDSSPPEHVPPQSQTSSTGNPPTKPGRLPSPDRGKEPIQGPGPLPSSSLPPHDGSPKGETDGQPQLVDIDAGIHPQHTDLGSDKTTTKPTKSGQPPPNKAHPQAENHPKPQAKDSPTSGSDDDVPFIDQPPKVGGQPVQKQANGDVNVGGTIMPEGQTASVSGHQVTNDPSHTVVNGQPHDVAPAVPAEHENDASNSLEAPKFNDESIHRQANGEINVGGTVIPEGKKTSISKHEIVNSPSSLVVDGNPHDLTPAAPAMTSNAHIGTTTHTHDAPVQKEADGNVKVGEKVVPEGQKASLEGHDVVNNPSSVVDGSSHDVTPVPPTKNDGTAFSGTAPSVNDAPVRKESNGNVIFGEITIPEGESASVGGHQVTDKPNNIVVDGTTHELESNALIFTNTATLNSNSDVPSISPPPRIGDQSVQKHAVGNLVIGGTSNPAGKTASAGEHQIESVPSHVNNDGTSYSVAPGSSDVDGHSAIEYGSTQSQDEPTLDIAANNGPNSPLIVFDPNPVSASNDQADPNQPSGYTSVHPADGSESDTAVQVFPVQQTPDSTFVWGDQVQTINSDASSDHQKLPVAVGTPLGDPPFPSITPAPASSLFRLAQLQLHGLAVHSDTSGGLIIGTQTLSINAQATIAGVSVSVGSDSIALGSTTYAIATHTTSPSILKSIPDNGAPFTIPISQGRSANLASLSKALPGARITVLAGGSSVVVNGYHPTSTISTDTAGKIAAVTNAVDDGNVRDAIVQAITLNEDSSTGDGQVYIMVPNKSTVGNQRKNGTLPVVVGEGNSGTAIRGLGTVISGLPPVSSSTQLEIPSSTSADGPASSAKPRNAAAKSMIARTKTFYVLSLLIVIALI